MRDRAPYARALLDRRSVEDGPLTFTASSTSLNRYGYQLRNDGWRLANYEANPVVLWAHDASLPPIGLAHAYLKDDKVVAEVTFDLDDDLGRRVDSKYRRGFLSAVSVGFDFIDSDGEPLMDWCRLSNEKIRDEVFYDLCEISSVPVPADPRALVQQQRHALRALGRQLVDLVDEADNPGSDATAEHLRAAVAAELERLGVRPVATQEAADVGRFHVSETAARDFLAALKI